MNSLFASRSASRSGASETASGRIVCACSTGGLSGDFTGASSRADPHGVDMRIEDEIHIGAEAAEVFAVLSDPERLSEWQPTTVAVRRQRQGPLSVGERFEEVHKGLGRELTSTVEVVACDAPRLF